LSPLASRRRQTKDGEDKRQSPRRPSDHLLSYTHLGTDKKPDDVGMGKTLDVSRDGVKIQTHQTFPVGTNFEMVIAVKEQLVEATGRIVHGRKAARGFYNMGISFVDIQEQDKEFLS
jgi:hypothetical protein